MSDAEEGEIPADSTGHLEAGGEQGKLSGVPFRHTYYSPPAQRQAAGGSERKKHKKKDAAVALELLWRLGAAPLRLADIQNCVLWALAEGDAPRWCRIKPKSGLKKVVLLVVHGIDRKMWEMHGRRAPSISRLLGPVTVQARNALLVPAQTTHALLTLPSSRKRPREDGGQQQQKQRAPFGSGTAEKQQPPTDRHHSASLQDAAGATAAATPPAQPQPKRLKLTAGEDVSAHHAAQLLGATGALVTGREAAEGPGDRDLLRRLPQREEGEVSAREAPPLSSYVLTLDQLEACGYPLPQFTEGGELVCPQGFVATRSCGSGCTPAHPLVALDCEMCTTAEGLELARCTVIDEAGRVLVDLLVCPRNPITDYNTRYSGISEATLEGVTARVEDAAEAFKAAVSAETVVVTHSGENDFKALKVIHANVVDTSVLFPHPRGPPARSALRVLASRFLRRTIQAGGAGHDPVEDARAALDLALLKAERGPGFGVGSGERGEKLADALGAAGRQGALVGDMGVVSRYIGGTFSAVVAQGDAEVEAKVAKEAARAGAEFVWAQLMAVHCIHEQRVAALKAAAAAPCPEEYSSQEWAEREGVALAAVDAAVEHIYAAAPPGTLFLVLSGQGDTAYQAYLEQQRYERQASEADGAAELAAWSVADEEAMRVHADRAMIGLCFLGVKGC